MINIFFSHSKKDRHNYINYVANIIESNPLYKLWYYNYKHTKDTMDQILRNLCLIDVFVFFISNNSLNSDFVQQEMQRANELCIGNKIKELCGIILEKNIDTRDNIPNFITSLEFCENPQQAVTIIIKYCNNI
ncbi:MAG: toll/interleukin-1 receptor domain-containing protein [Vallitalea sp.]|jgi:hypothetical protein|nr:toll/interleukin-1 receptor domain-containing protein [Vallitalea sp.]